MTSPDRELSVSTSLPSVSSPLPCVSSCPSLCLNTPLSRLKPPSSCLIPAPLCLNPPSWRLTPERSAPRTRSVASHPEPRASRRRSSLPATAALCGFTRSKLPKDRSDLGGEDRWARSAGAAAGGGQCTHHPGPLECLVICRRSDAQVMIIDTPNGISNAVNSSRDACGTSMPS